MIVWRLNSRKLLVCDEWLTLSGAQTNSLPYKHQNRSLAKKNGGAHNRDPPFLYAVTFQLKRSNYLPVSFGTEKLHPDN